MKIPNYFASCCASVALLLAARGSLGASFLIADGDVEALRAAIDVANSNGEDDTIELATTATYTLISPFGDSSAEEGLPLISADNGHRLVIHGNGSTIQRSAASGTPVFRIFHTLAGSNVAITDLIIRNGSGDGFGDCNGSGGLLNTGGTVLLEHCALSDHISYCGSGAVMNDGTATFAVLTVNDCVFSDNTGAEGGAIFNNGGSNTAGSGAVLVVRNSRVLNNHAEYGGGISNFGTFAQSSAGASATIVDTTISGNTANFRAGGVNNETSVGGHATLILSNSTLSSNTSSAAGALLNGAGTVQATNCTFYSNSAQNGGGAIYVLYDGTVTQIRNCTFSGNSTATGLGGTMTHGSGYNGVVSLGNTVLNGTGADMLYGGMFGGGFHSDGYNVCNITCGGYLTAPTDKVNTDPKLDPSGLKDNGGPTQTVALASDSPAINAGNDAIAS